MSEARLPYGRQSISRADVEAVAEALAGDFLTTGPTVERFERALAECCGAGHAVVVSSGTAALHAAYYAAGLGPGDEIVTTPLTFVATASAALHLGATVRFVDVEPDTGTLDPAALAGAVGERTRLVVPIDYAGHPADYDAIRAITDERGLTLVADAAHSLGASYRGRPVGTLADLSATSFHPVKPVTTCEGGAVLTGKAEHAERARRFRNHGIVRQRPPDSPYWFYEVEDLGFNYRLSDVQSALGLSQLGRLEEFLARRRAIAGRYLEALADLPQIILPVERPEARSGWHLFVVQVSDPTRRRAFFEHLRDHGLLVQVHYIPVHHHPYFRRLGLEPGLCPVAEERFARSVSLPLFPAMTDDDVDRVIDQVHRSAAATL